MATYIGFSTKNANRPRTTNARPGVDGGSGTLIAPIVYGKKYKMTDEELVMQDFINSLNIPQGQKVGNPSFGTTLWSFIFEPNTADVQLDLETEIRRMASFDPRITLNTVKAYPKENGILLEVELAFKPSDSVQSLQLFFDQSTSTAFGVG